MMSAHRSSLLLAALGLGAAASPAPHSCQNSGGFSMLQTRDGVAKGHLESNSEEDWINVCYFTNWARYRTGLINDEGKDVFEMGLSGDLCTHFMYGFCFSQTRRCERWLLLGEQ